MAVIKLVEDYAVAQLRKDVRDSLTMAGEQSVLLRLFHAEEHDAVPCPQCGDDIYKSPEKNCASCYGTMFDGGVREAMKVWALYTDHQVNETLGNRGVYEPDHRHIQFEAFPLVTEHDVVVRVKRWDHDTPTEVEGYYLLDKVDRRSLRTGSRAGQYSWDVVGQKADLSELPDEMGMITHYPVLGQSFHAAVALTPASPTVPAHAVLAPDTRVIYFPFDPTTGTPATPGGGGGARYALTVGDGVATEITIPHQLHTLDVDVTVYAVETGEEVEPDVVHATEDTVVLRFATAPALFSYRVVIS